MEEFVSGIFKERFQNIPSLFIAPGRVNLLGEHIDYNDGLVLPAAIDKHIFLAACANHTDEVRVYFADLKEEVSFHLRDLQPGTQSVNYLMGVADGMARRGKNIGGIDLVVASTIPAGAGLSSSAALCCGFAWVLNTIFTCGLSRLEIAYVAQHAEHHFAGVKCGLMDQYASLFGEEESVLLLDCRTLTHRSIRFAPDGMELVLIDTKVKHSLASSAYNKRRASCEEGLRIINKKYQDVKSLRDVSRTMLYEFQDSLGEENFTRCRYVVEEMERVLAASVCIEQGDYQSFGKLMFQTHWGLSQWYEVSCEESNFLVKLAEDESQTVVGARMMGGGFGGCTINLIRKRERYVFEEKVREKYFTTFGKEPDFYPVSLKKGVHQI